MGPSRAEDFVCIEDLCDEVIPTLPSLVGFFSSGAGDYLAVELKSSADEGYIWWHEKPESPDKNINVWAVMDTLRPICVFLAGRVAEQHLCPFAMAEFRPRRQRTGQISGYMAFMC